MLPIVTRNFMDFVLFFANKTMSIRTSFDVKSRRQYLQIVNGWWPCQQITIKGIRFTSYIVDACLSPVFDLVIFHLISSSLDK